MTKVDKIVSVAIPFALGFAISTMIFYGTHTTQSDLEAEYESGRQDGYDKGWLDGYDVCQPPFDPPFIITNSKLKFDCDSNYYRPDTLDAGLE